MDCVYEAWRRRKYVPVHRSMKVTNIGNEQ